MGKLAIAGAAPLRTKPFTQWPQFDHRERDAILAVLESGNWGGYPFPNEIASRFSRQFAAHQDSKHALCAANGTVTLEIALKAIGIGPGDEVIVPAYTFEATVAPVLRLGAIPVFVDVLSDTYCIDPDAASGAIGDAGSFSMQSSKLMTSGEGGVITTNSDEIFELCESYVNCGRASQTDNYGHRILGFNYRMTEFQAAILLAQLERLPAQTELRAARAKRLSDGLSAIPGISLLARDVRLTTQAIYQFVFKYNAEAFGGASRDRFVAALEAEGIPAEGRFYEPIYRSPLFRVDPGDFPALSVLRTSDLPWARTQCPVAERAAYFESVWIPHQLLLGSEQDVDEIVEAVQKIQSNVDELLSAQHPLIQTKQLNRADRR